MSKENLQDKERESRNENGTTTIIALLIMMLLMGFVTFALTRSANETIAVSNEISETKTLFAAQASVENMILKADAKFEEKLSLDSADMTAIQASTPSGYSDYTFTQSFTKTRDAEVIDATGQQYQGLKVLRDEWQAMVTASENLSGVKVTLRRRVFDNRIPIFQFGIFYEDDLEFHPGPRFDFGGRVHSNGNLFMMAGTGLYFSSRVSAVGQVFTDVARNGRAATEWGQNVWIKNASGTYVQLLHNRGSVLTDPVNGSNLFASNSDMPVVYRSANWNTNKGLFQGNLLAEQTPLNLPIKIASQSTGSLDYIELIRRGKSVGDLYNNNGTLSPVTTTTKDSIITSKERYANKRGIRVSLSDSKAKLPGCASGTGTTPVSTPCGRRLDGNASGSGDADTGDPKGYQPKEMTDGYQATRVNGERFDASGKKLWIKVELVDINASTGLAVTKDVTEDILSLGVTEPAQKVVDASNNTKFEITGYGTTDSRSIIKLQRFNIPGIPLTSTDTTYMTSFSTWNGNVIIAEKDSTDNASVLDNGFTDNAAHMKAAIVDDSTKSRKVVPFPIQMFDTREGLYNDTTTVFDPTASGNYGSNVPWAGVMSMVDIDIANLKKFLNGDFNSYMPTSGTLYSDEAGHALRNTDVPQANGWVLYVSDRRGDGDFDGEYDMEDIYGNNDGTKQTGEDVNNNGVLDTDYSDEAVRYTGTGRHTSPAYAASVEHPYYRRGVRLINGSSLPGTYDSSNPLNTKGLTVASENGVYVLGNYNATGVSSAGTPTPSTDYQPQNTPSHIPAAIAADAVTILSRSWNDAKSFRYPFTLNQRKATLETTVRFAMLAGDARSSYEATPNQGGGDPRLSGGVHNFKRFLEDWDVSLNYSGSLINLYNSRNNNGSFKCCNRVYSPPTRNWVFDVSFLDPTRIPPGTPFLQSITLTGFERIND